MAQQTTNDTPFAHGHSESDRAGDYDELNFNLSLSARVRLTHYAADERKRGSQNGRLCHPRSGGGQ